MCDINKETARTSRNRNRRNAMPEPFKMLPCAIEAHHMLFATPNIIQHAGRSVSSRATLFQARTQYRMNRRPAAFHEVMI